MSEPVSWLLIRRGWQVLASDGTVVGRIGAVRGEPTKDIFNGIVVRANSAPPRYIPSDYLAEIVSGQVTLKLSASEFEALSLRRSGRSRRASPCRSFCAASDCASGENWPA